GSARRGSIEPSLHPIHRRPSAPSPPARGGGDLDPDRLLAGTLNEGGGRGEVDLDPDRILAGIIHEGAGRVAPGPAPGAEHPVSRTTRVSRALGITPARGGEPADASTGSGARRQDPPPARPVHEYCRLDREAAPAFPAVGGRVQDDVE